MGKNKTMNKNLHITIADKFFDAVEITQLEKTFTANLGDMIIERKKTVESDAEHL